MRQSLQLKTSQSLVMTQQLQQSIKLLQMGAQELNAYIDAEMEKNPFLQPDDGDAPQAGEQENFSSDDQGESEEPSGAPMDASGDAWESGEWERSSGGEQAVENWEYTPQERISTHAADHFGEDGDFADTKANDISLREHLAQQAAVEIHDPIDRRIAEHLIDLVDEAGYVRDELDVLAAQLGTEESHVEAVLKMLQRFDPVGVCARDLKECLEIQLREKNRLDPAMQMLLQNLPLLASAQLDKLKRLCAVDEEDLKGMIAEIRALSPKPGLAFTHEIVQPVEPDVVIRREAGKAWHIELNSQNLPKVLVNRRYYARVATSAKGTDKKYLSEQMNAANWLIKALDQRANTILKVTAEIVAQQDMFFRLGIHHLKPLTLKDIAKVTGFHESTISRVTTGKFLMSPRGMYELKYFFTSGLAHKAGGDDVSSETVRHLIKEMIDAEDAKAVLSDDDLAEKLKARNIHVARRTVAKYRESLGIPSSMQRRRQKLVSS